MISLGRVYDGLMVDVQALNEKLVGRSEEMLVRIAGCDRDAARDALQRAHGSVKLARHAAAWMQRRTRACGCSIVRKAGCVRRWRWSARRGTDAA